MKLRRFSVVIPAAGLSSRMGEFKPLLPLGEGTVIERVVRLFAEREAGRIVVVVGHRQEWLRAVLDPATVSVVENPEYLKGMFTSITTGIRHIDPASEAFFLLPADIALVRPHTLERLAQAHGDHPGKILHPVFTSERGHPPLIPTTVAADILGWRQDGGLKAFFENRAHPAVQVPVADRHILFDSDTPATYAEMQRRWERYGVPTPAECNVILTEIHRVAERTLRHGRKVADIAERLAKALIQAGRPLDLELIQAGALLHDVAKGQKDHAEKGALLLSQLGFAQVADIVGQHTTLIPDPEGRMREIEVVHMADKFVRGDQVIPIAQRFAEPLHRWADDPSAVVIIKNRRAAAYRVKAQMEALLGQSLEKVIGLEVP